MPIKFIFDRLQKQQEETIAQILGIIKREPHPDRSTVVLSKFTEALFDAGHMKAEEEKKAAKRQKQPEEAKTKKQGEALPKITAHELELIKAFAPSSAIAPKLPTSIPSAELTLPQAAEKTNRFEPHYTLEVLGMPVEISVTEDPTTKKMKYYLNGPKISLKLLSAAKEMLQKDFEKDPNSIRNDELLAKTTKKFCEKNNIEFSEGLAKTVKFFLQRDWLGFMKLEPLLRDPNIKNVYCDGADKPVAIELSGMPGKIETDIMFTDNEDINSLIIRIAKKIGSKVTKDRPILNTVFGGVQIQGIIGVGGVSSKLTLKKLE